MSEDKRDVLEVLRYELNFRPDPGDFSMGPMTLIIEIACAIVGGVLFWMMCASLLAEIIENPRKAFL